MATTSPTRPYYTVYLDCAGCHFDVRLNDVPLLRNDGPGNALVDIPANPWIVSGANTLSMTLRPAAPDAEEFVPDARARLMLCVREIEAAAETRKEIGGLGFTSGDLKANQPALSSPDYFGPNPPEISLVDSKTVRLRRKVALGETPLPRWIWQDGLVISDNPESFEQLRAIYLDFHGLLARKQLDRVRELTREKARELAKAYYVSEEEGFELIEFERHTRDPDLELYQFREDGLRLELAAEGRLARLVAEDDLAPVLFRVKHQSIALFMHMFYCLTPKREWLQIR